MDFKGSKVWVAGEVLIDLFHDEESQIPIVGGGPANIAKALASLGVPVSFIGGISTDNYGNLISRELCAYGVDLSLTNKVNLPSSFALVDLDEFGVAKYEFKLEETATFNFGAWLPSGSPSVLSVGSLAIIVEPGASRLFEWASQLNTIIIFDPNVRVSVLSDRKKYREYFEKWLDISDVVKLSEEDLLWLNYSVEEILQFGVDLVVVTRGEKGLSGFRINESYSVEAAKVEVVDTVGAGDTVGAVLIEGLLNHGELIGENLRSVLERASRAAAITCSRAGAKPPNLAELNSESSF